ncbi:glycosyltransferase [Microvirga sp. W0021]|uniref:Glycosyltransferase n=1 Tax=Hohaiivirga grylli TaxID=3133970 RepID=A0ABV0BH94_9HYPH
MKDKIKKPRVGIALVTYNHEKYIIKALESVAAQRIDEPYIVYVADDCSTDNTLKLIKDFSDKIPYAQFIFLENKSNLGITKNYERIFSFCETEYLAILEGDDYWINSNKLQMQKEFLDEHLECNLCASNFYIYYTDKSDFKIQENNSEGYTIFSARDLINSNIIGNFSTTMYRVSALKKIPSALFELKAYDWIINIFISYEAQIGFLKKPLSVYRIHENSSWSALAEEEKLKSQYDVIDEYDKITNFVFSDDFKKLKCNLLYSIQKKNRSFLNKVSYFIGSSRFRNWFPPIILNLINQIVPYNVRIIIMYYVSKFR